ncbi:DUF1284 domain-containing protein [Ensifer sp. 4252]|uniref:DUF1284 domain-containing protein n=1 Tax=Ensifer sp. 4252 TaxID=3373915 RepID=UPI003D22837A
MTVRLRGHHLLCLLTFVGEGYTPSFTRNYVRIAERLSAGESVTVVDGPDDICAPMLCDAGAHCREDGITRRDSLALAAISDILDRHLEPGSVLVLDAGRLRRLRSAFAKGKAVAACAECEWAGLCSRVADGGFTDALVRAAEESCSLREEV